MNMRPDVNETGAHDYYMDARTDNSDNRSHKENCSLEGTMQDLKGRQKIKGVCKEIVYEINRYFKSKVLKFVRKMDVCQEFEAHVDDMSMFSSSRAILLWHVWTRDPMKDAIVL